MSRFYLYAIESSRGPVLRQITGLKNASKKCWKYLITFLLCTRCSLYARHYILHASTMKYTRTSSVLAFVSTLNVMFVFLYVLYASSMYLPSISWCFVYRLTQRRINNVQCKNKGYVLFLGNAWTKISLSIM